MKKYYCIELLRFFSAIAIMIFHYGTSINTHLNIPEVQGDEPFISQIKLLYSHGEYAISIFFCISGLVFSNLYLQENQKNTFRNFFVKRFARLYPLHILTLFLIIALQLIFLNIFGSFQLYTFNDFYHFFLHIFYLFGWGFEEGRSFNAPIWTVSLEISIYFIFFFLIILIKKYKFFTVLLVYLILLYLDKSEIYYPTINFIYFINFAKLFFSGVFIYLLVDKYKNYKLLIILSLMLIFLSFLGNFKLYLFAPSVLLLFTLLDNFKIFHNGRKYFEFFGSLTYSIYLFHTVTFLFGLLFLKIFNTPKILNSEIYFIFYLLFTIFISYFSFKFFEKPLNKKIRKKLIN